MSSIQITTRVLPEAEKNKKNLLLTIYVITVVSITLLTCTVYLINFKNSSEINTIELFLDCTNIELKFKAMRYGDFWFLNNFVIGSITRVTTCEMEVTYVTQSDDYRSFLQQLPDFMRSWQTHISVTLYADTTDLITITSAIHYARNCMSDSGYIMKFVTFHILLPFGQLQHVASTEDTSWSSELNCNSSNALLSNSTLELKQLLIYPMNIAANLACKSANTALLLKSPSNVLLFPGLHPGILIMLDSCHGFFNAEKRFRCVQNLDNAKVIYLLSTYELKQHLDGTNKTKQKLHIDIMNVEQLKNAYHPPYPIYIGHKSVPYFDERFLETDDDYRFLQNYTMYLQNYSYRELKEMYFLNYMAVAKIPSSPSEQQLTIKSVVVTKMMREYSILFGSFGTE